MAVKNAVTTIQAVEQLFSRADKMKTTDTQVIVATIYELLNTEDTLNSMDKMCLTFNIKIDSNMSFQPLITAAGNIAVNLLKQCSNISFDRCAKIQQARTKFDLEFRYLNFVH